MLDDYLSYKIREGIDDRGDSFNESFTAYLKHFLRLKHSEYAIA